MKILWIVNIMLPEIGKALGVSASNREGWLTGIFNRIKNDNCEYEISIAYPVSEIGYSKCVVCDCIDCYPFVENLSSPEVYDVRMEGAIRRILDEAKPDMIHIFGTEFPHALAFAKLYNNPSKTLVGLQGICGMIAKEYMALLPKKIRRSVTLRDFLKRDSIIKQQRKFYLRAVNEIDVLQLTNNVTGRTFFDETAARHAKENIKYYKINETMRDSFYSGRWDINNINKYTIFIGQGDYPIKGMHFLLEAASELVKKYPDLKIRIAGNSIISHNTLKDKLKTPAYGKYLRKIISDNNLSDRIEVLGSISEERMKEEYLNAAVYVCASFVENSPNTLAEAMLLGMPIVTSNAGGILDMISKKEGIIFNRGCSDELKDAIDHIFVMEDNLSDELITMCDNCYIRARDEFDGEKNYRNLMNAYSEILDI